MGRFPAVEKEIVSEDKPKPVLDEETLAKLLEAAYVLQEHNRELQEMELGLSLKRDQLEAEDRSATVSPPSAPSQTVASEPATDYTLTLAKIVELQRQIQLRQLELGNAISLVTERLTEIASASGTAVGILEGKKLLPCGNGVADASPRHSRSPGKSALCRLHPDGTGFS